MPIYIDVVAKLSQTAARNAAREAESIFGRAGRVIAEELNRPTDRFFEKLIVGSRESRASVQELEREFERLSLVERDAARKLERSQLLQSAAQAKLAEQQAKYGESSSKALQAQAALAAHQAKAEKAGRDYADTLAETEAAHRAVAVASGEMAAGTEEGAAGLESLGARAGAAGGPLGAVAAAVAGIGAAMAITTPKAAEFQKTITKLHTAADVPADQLPGISKGLLNLAPQVGYGPDELGGAAYTAAKAHFQGDNILKVVTAASQLAAIEQAPLEEVMSALTTSMTDYNVSADDAAKVASQIRVATGGAKTSLQAFAGALHNVEPVASKMGISLPDEMAALAQVTQSGMSPDQASQDLLNLVTHLSAPTNPMRAEMGELGIDPADIQQNLGSRGILGTMQVLQDAVNKAVKSQFGDQGLVAIQAQQERPQVEQSMQTMMANMTDSQRQVAEAIKSGQMSFKEFRKSKGGLSVDDANVVDQWLALFKKDSGFSDAIKGGQGAIQTQQQAWEKLLGGETGLKVGDQLMGANLGEAMKLRDQTAAAGPEAGGAVNGFGEASETFDANVKKMKAAWSSLEVSAGNLFLPTATKAVKGLNSALDFLIKHKTGIHQFADIVGGVFSAAFSIFGTAKDAIMGVVHSLEKTAPAFKAVGAAAKGVWDWLKKIPQAVGGVVSGFKKLTNLHPFAGLVKGAEGLLHALGAIPRAIEGVASGFGKLGSKGFGGVEHLLHIPGHAAGGPVVGTGPNGIDSVLSMLAPGEHVWTDKEVAAAGGHQAMYRMRRSVLAGRRFAGGGAGDGSPDDGDGHSVGVPGRGPLGTHEDPVFVKTIGSDHHKGGHHKHNGDNADTAPGAGNDNAGGMPEAGRRRPHRASAAMPEMKFGADLPENMGLDDGIQGLAQWAVTMLGNMAVAPIEGAMMGSLLQPPNSDDTMLSWLSPGEFVEPKSAVDKLGTGVMKQVQKGQLPHFRSGGSDTGEDVQATGLPMGSSGESSKGLNVGGGAVGTAEGLAATAADMFAPGSGQAVQMASQLLNRTAAYGGQVAGIAVQGLMSTFLPSDSKLSDFGNTLPGKILAGVAGAKPAAPVVAGNTKKPLEGAEARDSDTARAQGEPGTVVHMHQPTIQTQDMNDFQRQAQTRQMFKTDGDAVGFHPGSAGNGALLALP